MKGERLNVLFVCKYNVLRSKIAEAYLKKINRGVNVRSAGIISGGIGLYDDEKRILKKVGLALSKTSTMLSKSLLDWADVIVIIANDIPKKMLLRKDSKRNVEVWKVRDGFAGASDKQIERIITTIMRRVDRRFGNYEN